MLDWGYEERLYTGYTAICGIDEAGRGPLAGPVVAAAVILPKGCRIAGLDDSKKLTARKREALFSEICEKAVSYGIAEADHRRIDEINILQATFEAMRGAVQALSVPADFALVDGNHSPVLPIPDQYIIDGDALVPSIAAASILAKVTRDHFMELMAAEYPDYGFERHKGYGTRLHYAAILEHGACPIHRKSFLKKFYKKTSGACAVTRGEWGEAQAAAALERSGFQILERNYRTRYGELDLIAERDGFLVFAEVKMRKNNHFAAAREAVTLRKQEKLRLTAELWLQEHPTMLQPRFDVIEVYGEPGGKAEIIQIENAF